VSDLELRVENAEGELAAQIRSTRRVIKLGCSIAGALIGFALYTAGMELQLAEFQLGSPALTAVIVMGTMAIFAMLVSAALSRAVLRRRAREWAQQIAAKHQVDVERIIHLAELWEH